MSSFTSVSDTTALPRPLAITFRAKSRKRAFTERFLPPEMARRFDGLSQTTLRLRLKEEIPSLSESILDNILEHKIDGEVFLSLNGENCVK